MLSQPPARAVQTAQRAVSTPPTAQPTNYCPVPQRLLADLRDTPLAIGLYALIARLYLVHQAPIPLSRDDILRYDPTLKAGAVKRACDRLVAGGWLVEPSRERHRKQRYTPTWGHVNGTALPWRMDHPCLGRPRHITRLPLDRSLLDICMGKLTPHPTQLATITRYITIPALSLADIGCYALTQAERPHETPNLRWLGLVRNGRALPLPADERLLALITQRPLTLDDATSSTDGPPGRLDTELTASGARRLGLNPSPPPSPANDHEHPLFFVPPHLIGSLIGPLIGSLIGPDADANAAPTAPLCPESRPALRPAGITWESNENRDKKTPPPTPPATGGGAHPTFQKERKPPRAPRQSAHLAPRRQAATELQNTECGVPSAPPSRPLRGLRGSPRPEIPDTAATQLLKTINVRPEQLIELADLPAATVAAAITDGRARDGIRDLAGWVVSLLRTQRDYGWQITPPAPRPDSPEALRAAFARYAADQEAATELPIADCARRMIHEGHEGHEARSGLDHCRMQNAECRMQNAPLLVPSSPCPPVPPSPCPPVSLSPCPPVSSASSAPSAVQTSPAPCPLVPLSPCLPPSPLRVLSGLRGSPLLMQLWDDVQAALRLQITRSEYETGIQHAQLHAIEAGVATIIVPTAQIKDRIESRLLPQLRDLLTLHVGEPISVRLILNGACRPAPAP
jgi:hypothetical protein